MEEELQKEMWRLGRGWRMEMSHVRGIKMVTKEVDEEIWTIAMRI